MINSPQYSAPRITIIPAVEVLPTDCGYVVRQHGTTIKAFDPHQETEANILAQRLAAGWGAIGGAK